ncbi:MAG: phosphotransferase [Pseudomonadales bacterium]|nr:phosphotransferase [Pseudomonadales bacterium]
MSDERLRAARAVLRAWNLEVEDIHLVSVTENIAFRVDDRAGGRYVLRLHRPWYHDLDELISEQTWTAALRAAGVDVPVPVMTRDGEGYASVEVAAERRHAGLLEWVDGPTMHQVMRQNDDPAFARQCFAQLGEIMASIHNQSAAWTIPPGFRRQRLDADGLMGEQPFWGRFWESPHLQADERPRLAALRETIHGILADYGTEPGTFGLIHADLHPNNVIDNGEALHVIDFDDAGFGWHAYEFAVALSHFHHDHRLEAFCGAMIDGYRRHRAVDDETVARIPLFLLVRSLASIGWTAARPELDHGDWTRRLVQRVDESADEVLARYR